MFNIFKESKNRLDVSKLRIRSNKTQQNIEGTKIMYDNK